LAESGLEGLLRIGREERGIFFESGNTRGGGRRFGGALEFFFGEIVGGGRGGQKGILAVGGGGRGGENGFTMRRSARTAGFEGLWGRRRRGDFGFGGEGLDFLGGFLLPAGIFFDSEGFDLFGALGPEDLFGGVAIGFFGGCVMSRGRRSRRDGGDRRRSVFFCMGGDRGLCGLRDHRRWRDRREIRTRKAREGQFATHVREVFLFFRGDPSGEIIIRRGSGERARRGAIGGRRGRILGSDDAGHLGDRVSGIPLADAWHLRDRVGRVENAGHTGARQHRERQSCGGGVFGGRRQVWFSGVGWCACGGGGFDGELRDIGG